MPIVISHLKPPNSTKEEWAIQSNEEHSINVANLASLFASKFGFTEWGRVLGLLHDKGKEQKSFQQYIQQVSGYKPSAVNPTRSPHAYIGALIAKEKYPQIYPILSHPIIGHHRGLYDYGDYEERMNSLIPDEIKVEDMDINLSVPPSCSMQKEDLHHLVRMLFSCLVDADRIDTEAFMNEMNSRVRKNKATLEQLLPKLEAFLKTIATNAEATPINKIRSEIQAECLKASSKQPGFYSLTVPTGGGKTLSSLVWAIKHALKYKKNRIIIAIPYTSIIIQTAETLRKIFGKENILEHHSNINPERKKDKMLDLKMELAAENWDYPIIVTTNVQLFESIFSNKPSICRKLHNISNSVLILDEVQVLPIEYLQPIIDSLQTYQRIFSVSVLFTTASMPALREDYNSKNISKKTLRGIPEINEIIPTSFNLHNRLRRVNLHFDKAVSTYKDIANRIAEHNRVLCVVNTRKDAQAIYESLPPDELTFHLSRMMCSKHVNETIETIKHALTDKKQRIIRVISTQLIEAGVDIDFPIVFRQEAGLDSILQAAGRCNREGKLEMSDAYVFKLDKPLPPGYISNSRDARENMNSIVDWFSPEAMIDYFSQLYTRCSTFDKADIISLLYKPLDFSFEEAAKKFNLIDNNSKSIIVNYKDSMTLVNRLQKEGPTYELMKYINQYTVNINDKDFKDMRNGGMITEIIEGIYVLPDIEQYDDKVGLIMKSKWLEEIIII